MTQPTRAISAARPRQIGRTTTVRLAIYYLAAGAALFGLGRVVALLPPEMGVGTGAFPGWADAALQMISALALVLPVALVYVRTRTRRKYDASLVQTVIVLPITVAAILIVVQNSLALAFSLAGIVAAVRFRNTLRESRDAVYESINPPLASPCRFCSPRSSSPCGSSISGAPSTRRSCAGSAGTRPEPGLAQRARRQTAIPTARPGLVISRFGFSCSIRGSAVERWNRFWMSWRNGGSS